jgi:hypothetical protein
MRKTIKNKLDIITTILYVIFFISLPLKNNINSISLILLIIFAILNIRSFNISVFKKFSPLIFLFVISAVSLTYTENIPKGFSYLQKYLPFIFLPFIFSTLGFNQKILKSSLTYFTITIIVISLICEFNVLYDFVSNNDSFSTLLDKKYSYLNFSKDLDLHPTYFSLFIITAILSVYQYIKSQPQKKHQFLGLILILFLSFVILQLSNRTYLLILFIVLNWILYNFLSLKLNKKHLIPTFLIFNISLLLLVTNLSFVQKRMKQVFGFTYANGYKHQDGLNKLKQWDAAYNANNNILIGNGLGDANDSIYISYEQKGLRYFYRKKYNAHNQYIQFYVGLGIIGFMLLLYILIQGIIIANKLNTSLFFILYAIIPIAFITESYLERHHGFMFFSTAYCLIFYFNKTKLSLKTFSK